MNLERILMDEKEQAKLQSKDFQSQIAQLKVLLHMCDYCLGGQRDSSISYSILQEALAYTLKIHSFIKFYCTAIVEREGECKEPTSPYPESAEGTICRQRNECLFPCWNEGKLSPKLWFYTVNCWWLVFSGKLMLLLPFAQLCRSM